MKALHIGVAIALAWGGQGRTLATEPAGYLKNALPPPEFYLAYKQTLNLSLVQERTLREVIATLDREFRAADEQIAPLAKTLQAAVEDGTRPSEVVIGDFEALLAAENLAKRVRFRACLAARRLLTAEQWAHATRLLGPTPGPSAGEAGRPDGRVVLQKKLQRVRELAGEVFPDGPPAEYRRRIVDLQNQLRNGDLETADRMFDQLIADLEQRGAARKIAPSKP